MKITKLIDKLGDLLSADRRRQHEKRDKLKNLLRQMKAQQQALQRQLDDEDDADKRAGLELKLQILIEQRKKGIRLRKTLKAEG